MFLKSQEHYYATGYN